jgi:hypothetical protein
MDLSGYLCFQAVYLLGKNPNVQSQVALNIGIGILGKKLFVSSQLHSGSVFGHS